MYLNTYKFYSDPGHGWLAVPRAELVALGIINRISIYSYQRGQTVYLEEDCDAAVFLHAKDKQPKIVYEDTDHESPIRGYDHFQKGQS